MQDVGAALRRVMTGGTQPGGGLRRWLGVAVATAAAALTACATQSPPPASGNVVRLDRAITAGLDLYEAREYAVAAERFHEAAREAYALNDRETERNALAAECTSWLLAQKQSEFATCTERLAKRHRKARRPDPGLGTLLAMGAIAGDRPMPPFRVPAEVTPVLRAARQGGDY
jgi:hypothetical protein